MVLVNSLINNAFRHFYATDIEIDVVGCIIDGENRRFFFGDPYDSFGDHGFGEGYNGSYDLGNDVEPNHVIIVAKIGREIVDDYFNLTEQFEDKDETGRYFYDPIELVDDPKVPLSWSVRILANEIIKNNFDPNGFPTDKHCPFSLTGEREEFSFNIWATVRKDKYRFLSNGDGCGR
jgi:hypothetical protein